MAVHTCDLGRAAEIVLGLAGSSASVAIAGAEFARTTLLADLLGRRLPGATFCDASAYSSDDARVDVRIWMDDPGGLDADLASRRALGETVRGQWVAHLTPEQQAQSDARDRAGQAARDRADILFATLEGFDSVARLRFMSEICCDFALWDDHNGFIGDLEDLLPIPAELAERIRGWAVQADSPHAPPGLDAVGRALADELQAVLGPGYRIDYRG